MKYRVKKYKDVTWREYQRFGDTMLELSPDEDEPMTVNEMTETMFCAAIIAGWAEGIKLPEMDTVEDRIKFSEEIKESLAGERPGNVIDQLDRFLEFYTEIKQPDPN